MHVLITGGSSGIGKAAAEKLLKHGHEVTVYDLEEPEEHGGERQVEFEQGDVRDRDRVREVVEEVDFNVLVNCAGFYEMGAIEDMEGSTAEKIFDTNVHGPLNFIRYSMEKLRENDGRIVNITSVAGRISMPYFGVYCGSKHALESISDSLRRETEVEVVIVEPGVVETGFNERARNSLEKYVPESFHSEKYWELLEEGGMDGIDPDRAAETFVKAVETEKPKRRYQVPLRAKLITWLSLLPHALKDRIFRKFF